MAHYFNMHQYCFSPILDNTLLQQVSSVTFTSPSSQQKYSC